MQSYVLNPSNILYAYSTRSKEFSNVSFFPSWNLFYASLCPHFGDLRVSLYCTQQETRNCTLTISQVALSCCPTLSACMNTPTFSCLLDFGSSSSSSTSFSHFLLFSKFYKNWWMRSVQLSCGWFEGLEIKFYWVMTVATLTFGYESMPSKYVIFLLLFLL